MNRTTTVAAAVAAVLAGGSAMAQPSIAQINAVPSANTINIMGSSAIKAALLSSIENNFCGGSGFTPITSNGTNGNFLGVSCTPASGQATNGGIYNVWIRYEGGSVSGYLPIVNGAPVNEISGPALTANPITINGVSTGNGADDSFSVSAGGALVKVIPDLAIGDVEPKALTGNNYPTAYSTAVWGPVNNGGMFSLASKGLVNEVYALFVNESSGFTENPLNLSLQTIENILTHNASLTNWSQVLDVNGNSVGSGPITIVNREAGSGSRAATDILLVGDGCGSAGKSATLFNKGGATATNQYFSTGDVLAAANSVAGAITYATIDNSTGTQANKTPNMVMVTINNVAPSNLAAANGTYPFWVEAQYVNNAASTGADSKAVNSIVTALQDQATTAALLDINVIPLISAANGSGTLNATVHANPANSAKVPTGGGSATVYVNPYTRSGVTCNNPSYQATVTP
jgi:hypothetical protein